MVKSKPVQILRSFNTKELKRFDEYINSPYWKHPVAGIALYKILRKQHPEFPESQTTRQRIFRQLFPKETFSEQRLRYAMSDLTKMLEQFITQQNFNEAIKQQNPFLHRAYASLKLDKFFYQSINELIVKTSQSTLRDGQYHLNMYLLEQEKYDFVSQRNNYAIDELSQMLLNLDTFYIANKLRYVCEFVNNRNVFSVDYPDPLFWEAIVNYVDTNLLNQPPTIRVYRQVLLTLTNFETESYYHELLYLLRQFDMAFSKTELHDIYTYACNYCVRQINSGNKIYISELFKLSKTLLENEILTVSGELSEWWYKNIVNLSLRLNDFDFAKQFIEQYKKWLPAESRENAYHFNLAYYHFFQKQFGHTVELLNQVEFTDTYYHLDTKILLVKCYYELDEAIALFGIIETLKLYLLRNKMASLANKQVYNQFLGHVKKLMRIKLGSRSSLQNLRHQIVSSNKPNALSSWLIEKMDELTIRKDKRG